MKISVRNYKPYLFVLFFFSGAAALTYQVVWIRMLGLVFGVSAFAIATVLTSFMAGLGLGSFYFGEKARKSRNPLRLYAKLELWIGLFGLIFPLLVSGLKLVCLRMPDLVRSDFIAMSGIRFALSLVVLAVPTALMGGTLPVLSRIVATELRTLGNRVGGLYSVNNAGAIAGCLATGFLFIVIAGVQGTLFLAASINLAIAGTAWMLGGKGANRAESEVVDNADYAPETSDSVSCSRPIADLVLVFIGVEGFVSLAYELVWTRILSAAVLGNSVYSFCVATAVFIFGISLGSLISAAVIDKRKDTLGFFAFVEIAIGMSTIAFLALFCGLPSLTTVLFRNAAGPVWGGGVARDLFFSIVCMLVPAVLMGMAFPIAVKIRTTSIDYAARTVGIVAGVNIGDRWRALLREVLFS